MKVHAFQGIQRLILYQQQQTIVTGTVVIAWQGESNRDFQRQDLIFPVPGDNSGQSLTFDACDAPQALVMAFPTTIENRSKGGDNNIGWGVDSATIALVPDEQDTIAQITAKVVVEGQRSYLIRGRDFLSLHKHLQTLFIQVKVALNCMENLIIYCLLIT